MSSALQFNSVDELLPHEQPMMLLSGLESWDDNSVTVTVTIDGSNLFSNDNGDIPAWVGIEYMAQCIAVFGGIRSRLAGEAVKIGFLLGTRKYEAKETYFKNGSTLKITADLNFLDDEGLGLFNCAIIEANTGDTVASAQVKVIQPEDVSKIIEGENIS